jgi:hypothetical protein
VVDRYNGCDVVQYSIIFGAVLIGADICIEEHQENKENMILYSCV